MFGATTITPVEAYNIDRKIDDGLPQMGNITAMTLDGNYSIWAAGAETGGDFDPTTQGPVVAGDGVQTPPSDNTCYDNNNQPGGLEQYSIGYNNGTGQNCALSFKFQ